MKQLFLPLTKHPTITLEQAAQAIRTHIKESEILGDPVWDWNTDEWLAIVAVTPYGPLVRAAFRLKPTLGRVFI